MGKEYCHIIEGEQFKLISSDCVELVRNLAGKIPQSGIRYINDTTVVLSSNTVHDVLDCVRNQGWAHSKNPSRVKKGHKVYIVPNQAACDIYGKAAIGVSFIASQDVYHDSNNQFVWASE